MDSPFERSALTPRSPRPQPRPEDTPAPEAPEVVSTAELQGWMKSIESCLNEVCTIATEGKLNSDQKIKIHGLCRKIGNGTSHLAVHYQSVKQKCISAHLTIQHLNEKLEISTQLKQLKTAVEDTCKQPAGGKLSYADMIKKGPNNYIRPAPRSSIAIYPEDKDKKSEDTRSLVQQIINPEELKLQVLGVSLTKNGGVIISTESEDDIKKLKASEKLARSGLSVADPIKHKPRLIIFGLPSEISEKELLDLLYEQNVVPKIPSMTRDVFNGAAKLSHKSGRKDGKSTNFIIEVSATIRKILIAQERVFLNWSSFPIKDFTHVSRCFKCQQYGHSAKYCRDAESTCGHCGQLGHTMKECTKKEAAPVCATCQRYKKPSNHKTGDENCPARKFAVTRYINATEYEGA